MTTEFPPMFGGGIATYTFHASQMWRQDGHNVTAFLYDDTIHNTVIDQRDGIRLVRFKTPHDETLNVLGHVARLAYEYARIIATFIDTEGPPDIIESQDYLGIAYFVLQRKYTLDPLFKQVPVVVVGHSPKFLLDPLDQAPLYQLPEFWTGEMERFCYRAADLVVAPSRAFQAQLEAALPDLHSVVLSNPYASTINHSIASEKLSLIYVGRIQQLKGPHLVLEAMEALHQENVPLKADFVGGDTVFIPKAERLGILLARKHQTLVDEGWVTFHESLPPKDLEHYLTEHRIFVLPSLFESFSYVLLEAMHARRVVIAAATGIAPELIEDGVNGYLFTPGSADDLLRAIRSAMAQSDEEDALMGERAKLSLDVVSYHEVVTKRLKVYQRLQAMPPRKDFPWIRPIAALPPLTTGARELSVVIPFYNMGCYIEDTMASLNQVRDIDLEIIIVDDGSTDPMSLEALERLSHTQPHVRIIHTANQGLARARNVGASHASGTFLAFLDADDCVDPLYYVKALEILRYFRNVSFVAAWTQYFEASENLWITWNTEPPYILYHNTVNSSALIYRRQDFIDYGQNDSSMLYGMEDWESVIRLVSKGYRGVAIPEPLFRYRIRPDSMSRAFNRENQLFLYHRLTDLNPEFYQQYGRDVIHLMNANGPQAQVDNPTWQVGWLAEPGAPPDPVPSKPPSCLFRIRRRIRRFLRDGR